MDLKLEMRPVVILKPFSVKSLAFHNCSASAGRGLAPNMPEMFMAVWAGPASSTALR